MRQAEYYYKLKHAKVPDGARSLDACLSDAGHRVVTVERNPELLVEARAYTNRPHLLGDNLRKVIPSGADSSESEVCALLQELEAAHKITVIQKRSLD